MDRWRVLIAFVLLFLFGTSIGHARKIVIFGHGDLPFRGWFAARDRESPFDRVQAVLGLTETVSSFERQHPSLQRLYVRKRSDLSLSNGVSQSVICDTCLDISTFAEQVLADPDTVNSVLDYINSSVCAALPGLQDKCSGLAETYVPEMVDMLQVYVAPDKLCGDTKLCPSSSMLLLSDAHVCTVCTDFASEALTYLKDNKTETEILNALHSECSKLGEFSARCNLLVNAYAPLYIKEVDSVTPEQLCGKVGLCTTLSSKGTSRCAACELAVFEMKAKLRNPEVQEKMLNILLDGCSKVRDRVAQCKLLVIQYGPLILANIDSLVDADTVCTKIHACEVTPASSTTPAAREKEITSTTETMIQLPVANHLAASQ